MTLPASGPVSIAQINVELGRSSGDLFSMGGSAERTLAGNSSGSYSWNDYHSATRGASTDASGTGSGTTVNFGSQSFGEVGPLRRIVVAVHWTAAENNRTLSSATIGGVAAAIHVQDSHSGDEGVPGATSVGAAIVSALVPTGTAGTVSVTFSGSVTNCRVVTYRLVNAAIITVAEVRGFGDTSVNTTINISGASILIIAGSGSTNTTGTSMPLDGATQIYNANIGGALSGTMGGAISVNLPAQAGRPIALATVSVPNSGVELVAASFA